MSRYKIHVPVEQYGFLEAEFDTLVEAKIAYDEAKKSWAGEPITGMSTLEFSKFCQNFLINNTYTNEDLDKLSPVQQYWLKITSNALTRISDKNK